MELHRNFMKPQNLLKLLKLIRRSYVSISRDICDGDVVEGIKKKRKISVIRKILPKDLKNSPSVIESKDASEVIKNLNWEFKSLYGEVISPKSSLARKKTFKSNNTIIQNQTVFPVSESSLAKSIDLENNKNSISINYWQTLLKFPLLNEQTQALNSDVEISKMRKILEDKSKNYVPSITKILEKTMPPERVEILRRWKENLIKQLGEEGFQKYREELLSNGENLHACINSYLALEPRSEIDVEEAIAGHWKSLKAIFPSISDIKLLEEQINHPFLQYKGILDCFAQYNGNLVVIDWKTSKKKKLSLSSTFDNPLQIAAYVGALNFDPKFRYSANKGLIVVAYEDGSKASAHYMNENVMQRYWKEWLARVKLYWEILEKEEGNQT